MEIEKKIKSMAMVSIIIQTEIHTRVIEKMAKKMEEELLNLKRVRAIMAIGLKIRHKEKELCLIRMVMSIEEIL